uniref:Uncharacterized protein n=1 Tax=viral metagenome TaxID=1070528 RepID=A0A6C0I4J9_9ZZZZ
MSAMFYESINNNAEPVAEKTGGGKQNKCNSKSKQKTQSNNKKKTQSKKKKQTKSKPVLL